MTGISTAPPMPHAVRVLSESDLRLCAGLDRRAVDVIEEGFRWLVERAVDMPPIQHVEIREGDVEGDVDIKSAFVPGLGRFAVKVASGFYGNAALGLSTSNGLMVVIDARTGICSAVLLDNGYLTNLRTALAGAVAARHLAPETVDTAGVIGTGIQARLQARALHLERPFRRLLVHGRNSARSALAADDLAASLPEVDVQTVDHAEELVRSSQAVVTTTASRTPLIRAEWLHSGLHVTAMGSDLPGKQELGADVLRAADLYVCDSISQVARHGELQHVAQSSRDALGSLELGDVVSGRKTGRSKPTDITICDLTGTGVQDTAIALFALDQAEREGLGTLFGPTAADQTTPGS